MKNILVLTVLLLCFGALVSCGSAAGEGVLIVPSELSAASQETETAAAEVPDTSAVTESAVEEPLLTGDDVPERVRQILEDASFLALLEQYGVDTEAESDAVFGVASAVLDYLDAHPEHSDDAAVQTHLSDEHTVWWTQGGSVWHVTPDCSALAKSKSLQNGSEADAAAAGKSRVCKRCGS